MSQQKPSPPPHLNHSLQQGQQQRPRSNSVIRLKSGQNSLTSLSSTSSSKQSNSRDNNQFKRSMSVSEGHGNGGLHVKLPTLHHSETSATTTEPFPYSPVSQHSSTNNICPSESNWANKYDDFDIGKPIGYGSSAVVYEAIYKPLKKRVAVKMIDLDMFERNQIDELRRETALMALSKHPNVLRVYGSFVNGSKLYIVTPYLAAGSCLDIMKSSFPDGFEEISIATILRQALEGLIYLHKNGHIHRDVKAGNLLMDQQGTVLLADFGVSSSLAENGDVRKTFVGTPCWMAPEVMEQAGYDYKADIWSFGITSLELATGHAPFAKFPPMKVLMMTLSNAPPTLDREGGKHKYSKAFKDMIDMCLQKEPSKRPSAEKLLLHPFFKQAKKRDYLVKSVLSYVLPLDKRPHRKIPQKHISFQSTEQWDFDDDEEEGEHNNTQQSDDDHHPVTASTSGTSTPQQQQQQITSENINVAPPVPQVAAVSLERSRSVVQFEDCPKPQHLDRSKSTSSPSTSAAHHHDELPPIKKHISFGEVVIKDPPVVRSIMSPVAESPPPIMTSSNESNTSLNNVAPTPPAVTLSNAPTSSSKKSRFVIEDSAPSTSQTSSNTSPAPICDVNLNSIPSSGSTPPVSDMIVGVGLGISTATAAALPSPSNTIITNINTVPIINNSTPSSAAAAANITSNNNTLQEGGEFKKGRFSVNQTPTRPVTPSDDAQQIVYGVPTTAANTNEKQEYKATPMARAASQDSLSGSSTEQQRKSRFEVNKPTAVVSMATPVSVASTPVEPGTPLHSLPLSRENSNTSALSRDSSMNAKVSRFSVEKPEAVGPYCELPLNSAAAAALSPECRKKGRFELTGGSTSGSNGGGSETTTTSIKEYMNHLESPQSTVGPSPVISPSSSLSRGQAHRIWDPTMPHMVFSHMESLLKQTEIQKNMLHDLLATMPLMYNNNSQQQQQYSIPTRTRTISDSKKPSSSIAHNEEFYQRASTSNPSAPLSSSSSSTTSNTTTTTTSNLSPAPSSLTNDISSTVEHLHQLLLNSSKEREKLIRENEALKREVERLKRNQQASAPQQQQQQQQGILLKKQPSLDPILASTTGVPATTTSTAAVAQEATNSSAQRQQQQQQ